MIKVMIVEDDKLTRRGIISSVPWSKYQMQIVFETGNGISALEYMKENPVDLLITDIAMPIMSGMELLREAKKQYPLIQVVILTMYQDFEYIQEALRLGALDYIGKHQLEQEEISDMIERISIRLKESQLQKAVSKELIRDGASYSVITLEKGTKISDSLFNEYNLIPYTVSSHSTLYYLPPDHIFQTDKGLETAFDKFLSLHPVDNTMVIKLSDAYKFNDATLLDMLPIENADYFYIFQAGFHEIPVSKLMEEKKSINYENFTDCKQALLSLNWIHDTNGFISIMNTLQEDRVPYSKLVRLISQVETEIHKRYNFLDTLETICMPDDFLCFDHARNWLKDTSAAICHIVDSQAYSPYVIECLGNAVLIIQNEYNMPLVSDEIAKRVHLSRSYFCQCFKKIMNMSFNHYVRNVRIGKAKELLVNSNCSIQKIGEKTGYADEKYFSRIFRSTSGILPSTYRSRNKP